MTTPLPTVLRAACSCSLAAAVLAQGAWADEFFYDCLIETESSVLSQGTSIVAPFSGTLIGDFNAKTNPKGTQTRPGLFGGSGNQPIPYTASFVIDGVIDSNPTGAFTAGLDLEGLQMRMVGLDLDLLGGTEGVLPATVNINYQTFRTFAPDSLFPGGVTIPVPIGDARISELRAVQTGAGEFGTLTEQKDGSYAFAVAVPVDLILTLEVLGSPVAESSASPGVLPLTGRVSFTKDGGVVFTLALSGGDSQTQPIEDGAFSAIPLALPTVFPTGSVANLLISGTVTQITTENSLEADIVAVGALRQVFGDLDGNGAVGASDMALLLNNWGKPGIGDLDGDGAVGAQDLALLLGAWTAG